MTDSTSSRSSHIEDNNIKKKVSYSTDYMPNLLQDSQKMLPLDQRILFKKHENEQNSTSDKKYKDKDKDNYSNSSDKLSDYLTNDGENIANSVSNKYSNTQLYGNNNSFFSNGNKNNYKTDNEDKNINLERKENLEEKENLEGKENLEEKEKNIFNDTYDDYNELSPDRQMLKRLDMLRKLGELVQYGVKLSQNYNMNSDYFAMKYEYELHKNIRAKQNSVNWMSSLMLNCIYGIEILNEKYNPFDLKLKNWSEQINADINNYYDVFGEIYEKYNQPGKNMAPELKLVLMISGSALKFHLNNTLLSQNNKTPPNLQQSEVQDPAMLEQIRTKAAYEKIKEETLKNNELLKEKATKEHEQALKQMNDMMFLQNKKGELQKFEEENKKKIEEFAKMKMLLEQNDMVKQNLNNTANIGNMTGISGMNGMNGMNSMNGANGMNSTNGMNGMNGMNSMNGTNGPSVNGNINQKYEELRRKNINDHLQSIKDKVKNIDVKEDIDTEPLYLRAVNVKARELLNNNQKSNSVKESNREDTDRSTTSSNKSSTDSSRTSTNDESSSKRKSEKSVSTTLSKRKYNKKGITIQTN